MILQSIEYVEYEGKPAEWRLEQGSFSGINLIVGKNGTGKSRTLNVINALAQLLCEERKPFGSGIYRPVIFVKDKNKIKYSLSCEEGSVINERLDINLRNLMDRGADGTGLIYFESEKKKLRFQTPKNALALVNRRDTIQHSFLEDISEWGKSVRYYHFGRNIGQTRVEVYKEEEGVIKKPLNLKDTEQAVKVFMHGEKELGKAFVESVVRDMNEVGFPIENVGLSFIKGSKFQPPVRGELIGLHIKEKDLKTQIEQPNISTGMFMTLSLIIQVKYSEMLNENPCVLVDDIGEGLDYERASALVKLMVGKAERGQFQLLMTTNDRFVMNAVPLELWSIVERVGGECKLHNYKNSKKLFERFELTGLNNFDFFSSEYYLENERKN